MQVALRAVELRRARLPLAQPFRSAHSTRTERDVVVVRVEAEDGPDGWGECVAEPEPTYWPEYTASCWDVLAHHLAPRLLAGRPLSEVKGHAMLLVAFAALSQHEATATSLGAFLGATRAQVPTGIALGIADSVDELVDQAQRWHDDGHRAFKLKVRPGWDVEPARAVRKALGDDVALVADANGAYRSDDREDDARLRLLAHAELGLAALEQPYAPDDLVGHARLAKAVETPVCLDESIGSLGDLDAALALGAIDALCLKVGRVGGLVEAVRLHRRCREAGIAVRGGGMLETGLGRAVNLAVAALPGCTLPPDMGPSRRYFAEDLTAPFEAVRGTMAVPDAPGLGTEPLPDVLERATVDRLVLRAPTP